MRPNNKLTESGWGGTSHNCRWQRDSTSSTNPQTQAYFRPLSHTPVIDSLSGFDEEEEQSGCQMIHC